MSKADKNGKTPIRKGIASGVSSAERYKNLRLLERREEVVEILDEEGKISMHALEPNPRDRRKASSVLTPLREGDVVVKDEEENGGMYTRDFYLNTDDYIWDRDEALDAIDYEVKRVI